MANFDDPKPLRYQLQHVNSFCRPEFISDGWLAAEDALALLGQSMFGKHWSGQELLKVRNIPIRGKGEDRLLEDLSRQLNKLMDRGMTLEQAKTALWEQGAERRAAAAEIRQRGDSVRDRLRRLLDNGQIRYRLVSRNGEIRSGPPALWRSPEGGNAMKSGEVHIYNRSNWCIYTGFLLILETDLDLACAGLRQQADEARAEVVKTSSERERQRLCHNWFVDLMANNCPPPPELPTKDKQIEEAADRFQISKRAAEFERAAAIRATNNPIWSNPGRKSPQPAPDPRNDRHT